MPEHRYAQFCPLARTAEILCERWTLLVVRDLSCGPQRFTDLRRRIPGISPSVLTERLSRLEERGLVERREVPPPAPATLYALTPRGEDLRPVLREMVRFGAPFLAFEPGDHIEPEWVEMGVESFLRTDPVPPHALAIRISDGAREASFVVRGGAEGARLERFEGQPVDVTFTSPPILVLGIATGQLDPVELAASDQIRVDGDPKDVRGLVELLDLAELIARHPPGPAA